ncbi:MAG TPA: hypothetical protein PKO06_15180 [Candidatus Ozemobacteraceae bacterium]|nr:hypothetical protein [Candidatus Ozemobacteraceae bacterium]
MKIKCECGMLIHDTGCESPHVGAVISSADVAFLLDRLDECVENAEPTPAARERACMNLRALWSRVSRKVYQCPRCSRLFIDDEQRELRTFIPERFGTPCDLLRPKNSEPWQAY